MLARGVEAVVTGADEVEEIARLDRSLAAMEGSNVQVLLDQGEEPILLPPSVVELLARGVHALARSKAVAITRIQADLTTQQAADLLNVSRPFLIRLLEEGEIPYFHVGSHRRVPYHELMEYRERRSQVRRRVLAGMAREAQEMGIYE